MIAEDAMDSPSPIAVLLVWQQPHIIYMLEMAYQCGAERDFLERYYEVVEETARFVLEAAKAFSEGKCSFYDRAEFALLVKKYGRLNHFQAMGVDAG